MTEWTKDKEKKVLWKYRFLLTFRILRVIVILFCLYAVYMMLLSIGYSKTNLYSKNEFQMNLAIDWTQAGNYGESGLHGEITPFLSQKISFPLYRTIGKEEQPIGTVNLTKGVGPFSTKEITYLNSADAKLFQFYLPEDPRTGKALRLQSTPEVWSSLNKVHEGTVANLAFSTTTFLKPEELLDRLKDYDVDVLWMPLYTGELKELRDIGYTLGGDNYLSVDSIGLSKARQSDDYHSYSVTGIRMETIKENENIMLSNMKMLIDNESSSYLENVLGLRYLDDRYHYLKKNGFHVYGAVVTGPVKELLKLKNLDIVQGAELGKYEYWNWTAQD
ncbi:anti sigma factor C-terminal domain-containing protein [Neobacillus novalis]|uniref:Anti sigma factor C-terminal domain-containing protein n=1 Tax=Neobacillus novalis TaxID=220687 RepID=A0AA95S7P8_9BACI|nr:anti-sigma factor [Neobacillus novalis]WHY85020.1 anti sigma factor C-terminal domain-containing protein [Neobacillus novalis]